MFDLGERVALVTGAGQNVGTGTADALAAQGATVLVNDLIAERAETVAERIGSAGGSAVALPFDVTELSNVVEAMGRAGHVDILVYHAGNAGGDPMTVRQHDAI